MQEALAVGMLVILITLASGAIYGSLIAIEKLVYRLIKR